MPKYVITQSWELRPGHLPHPREKEKFLFWGNTPSPPAEGLDTIDTVAYLRLVLTVPIHRRP